MRTIERAWNDFLKYSRRNGMKWEDEETLRIIRATFMTGYATGCDSMIRRLSVTSATVFEENDNAIADQMTVDKQAYAKRREKEQGPYFRCNGDEVTFDKVDHDEKEDER